VVLVLAIVLSSLVTYAVLSGTSTVQPTSNSDQALIAKLLTINQELNRELQSKTTTNTTINGLDPVRIYRNDSAGVVTVQGVETSSGVTSSVLGTGFAYSFSGHDYIVTNYHVVQGVSDITVTFQTGDAYPATVLGSDGYSDLAVLNLTAPSREFHPLRAPRR
jgi:S1-C subfamily serine protease